MSVIETGIREFCYWRIIEIFITNVRSFILNLQKLRMHALTNSLDPPVKQPAGGFRRLMIAPPRSKKTGDLIVHDSLFIATLAISRLFLQMPQVDRYLEDLGNPIPRTFRIRSRDKYRAVSGSGENPSTILFRYIRRSVPWSQTRDSSQGPNRSQRGVCHELCTEANQRPTDFARNSLGLQHS